MPSTATAAAPVAEESRRPPPPRQAETEMRDLARTSADDAAVAARRPPPRQTETEMRGLARTSADAAAVAARRPPPRQTETEMRGLARTSTDDAAVAARRPPPRQAETEMRGLARTSADDAAVAARRPPPRQAETEMRGLARTSADDAAVAARRPPPQQTETEMRGLARTSADDAAVVRDKKSTASREEPPPEASDPLPVSSPPRAVIAAQPRLPRRFLGFTMLAVSNTYVPLATGVFVAVNITFMGFTYMPPDSVLALPSPCSITRADVHELYTLLAVGLVFSVGHVLASALAKGALKAREDARKQLLKLQQGPALPPPRWQGQVVHCRVLVAAAAACLAVSIFCTIRAIMLAVSIPLGKSPCWTGANRGFLGAGTAVASLLAAYCVAAGLGAAFYAD
ncbi:unnamed protein product [Urochloa humidicola]